MKQAFGVLNTDRVNRQNMRIAPSGLAEAMETMVIAAVKRGLPAGAPSHISHDRHRLYGWMTSSELHIASDMTRQLGGVYEVETADEKASLASLAETYWAAFHAGQVAPYREALEARAGGADLTDVRHISTEAACLSRIGLAEQLYPHFFRPGLASVDKDGLVDVGVLLETTTQVLPGVFHDKERDLLLFAHRFFRRSQSHANNLNAYFLKDFDRTIQSVDGLRARLRLDPDLVGHPDSACMPIELEYWRGPRYEDDIAAIPSGVAEHKADDRQRFFEGVDKTQLWWKSPESRTGEAGPPELYRTFEVEELVENSSPGVGADQFACRYAHAEYRAELKAVSHFDGAIRAYGAEPYLERIEAAIDRAGKQADYTKLFRLDGVLPVERWKSLLTTYFRGNRLIPEYLGDAGEEAIAAKDSLETASAPVTAGQAARVLEPRLAALVSFKAPPDADRDAGPIAEEAQEIGGLVLPFVEIGLSRTAAYLRDQYGLTGVCTVGFKDDVYNLSLIGLGDGVSNPERWSTVVGGLAAALKEDVEGGIVKRASCSFTWRVADVEVRLSVGGEAGRVDNLLQDARAIVMTGSPASVWIDSFAEAVVRRAEDPAAEMNWRGMRTSSGRLSIRRSGELEFVMTPPEGILERMKTALDELPHSARQDD